MANKGSLSSKTKVACLSREICAETEWGALRPREKDLFNRRAVCRTYQAGQVVFVQGGPCRGLYLVKEGLIAIRKFDDQGQSVIVRLAYKNHTLGYRPLLAKEHHHATAEVIKEARICFLDAPTVHRLIENNPKLGMNFLENTARAFGQAEDRLFQIAALSVRVRTIHLLMLLRDHFGTTTSDGTLFVELPMSRRDMAEMIGARPESVSRVLSDIQSEGLVHMSGRTVRVDRFDKLTNELHQTLQ